MNSDCAAGGNGGGPGPLEVKSAEVACHVDGFTDEEEPRDGARLHGARMQIACIDAARGHFRLFKSLSASWVKAPVVQGLLSRFNCGVCPSLRRSDVGQVCGEALREC